MKKTLKIAVMLTMGAIICSSLASCKSSKSSEGVMYNQKRKGSQAIKSNYRVVGENVIEYSSNEQPAI